MDRLIGTIPKNSEEELRIGWNSYNGFEYLDIRLYFESEGEWKPTKKGITLRPEQVPDLLELVERAITAYKEAA